MNSKVQISYVKLKMAAIKLLMLNILFVMSLELCEKSSTVFSDEHILLVVLSFILQCR